MTKLSREASGLGEGDAGNDNESPETEPDDAGQVEHDDGRVETGTVTDGEGVTTTTTTTTEAPNE